MGLKIEKKPTTPSTFIKISVQIIGVLITLVVTSIMLSMSGASITEVFNSFLTVLGTKTGIAEMFVKAIPLLLVALGISIAFRCQVFNVGAEGQIIIGAITAGWMGINLVGLPALLLLPLILAISFLAGGLWGGVAGVLKAKFGINEVIVTIMMNFVSIYLYTYLLMGPMGTGGIWPISPNITEAAYLPILVPGTRFHSGFLLALLLAGLVWILLFRTVLGYRIRAVGAGPVAARHGGISIAKMTSIAMLLSGGFAGIAGASEVMGVYHQMVEGLSGGYGFAGIVVGYLGGLHPIGAIIAAILYAVIIVGMHATLRITGVSIYLMWAILGLLLIFLMIGKLITEYRIKRE